MNSLIFNYLSSNRHILLLLIGTLTLITLFLTLIPSDKLISSNIWTYDKLGHLLMFGSWTYLFGIYQYTSSYDNLNLLTIFLVGVSFGLVVELLQYLLPVNRNADLFDIAFDSLGSLIAVLILKKGASGNSANTDIDSNIKNQQEK